MISRHAGDHFYNIIQQAIRVFVPVKRVNSSWRAKRGPTSMKIRKLRSKKFRLWRSLRKNPADRALKVRFKLAAKSLKQAIVNERIDRETDLINSTDKASFYKYINSKLGSKSRLSCILGDNGEQLTDPFSVAQAFNKYFASVYSIDNEETPHFASMTNNELSSITFSALAVQKVIARLKPTLSMGPDGIPNILLKKLSLSLCGPLSYLFERSFSLVFITSVWKTAKIVPILKKGSALKVSNYRPISLTSTISKVMERIISDQLLVYLNTHELTSPHQYGFQKSSSTVTHLLDCQNDWVKAQNDGDSVDIIYLDYARAFDSVVHNKLLIKLAAYGVRDTLLLWIERFLSGRTHFVSINIASSELLNVLSGVPQGTILGPILFLIYVNDMPQAVDKEVIIKLFADDSKVYKVIESIKNCLCLQRALINLLVWSTLWQLKLNIDKCLVLHLGRANPMFVYTIKATKLLAPDYIVHLGITLSRNLTFHKHVNRILADCFRKLFIIQKCFLVINEDILRKLYVSYLRPSLEYGSVIWAPHSDSEIKLLDAFQHRVLTVHGHNIVLESLETRRMRMDLTWYYKILHNLTCLNQANFFIQNIRQGLRSHELSIVVPRTTTSAFKFAFAQRRIAQWNAFPSHVAGARTLSHFKELISSYVI